MPSTEEAKALLEDTIRTIQSDGVTTVEGWEDGCVSVKRGDEDLVVKPLDLLPATSESDGEGEGAAPAEGGGEDAPEPTPESAPEPDADPPAAA